MAKKSADIIKKYWWKHLFLYFWKFLRVSSLCETFSILVSFLKVLGWGRGNFTPSHTFNIDKKSPCQIGLIILFHAKVVLWVKDMLSKKTLKHFHHPDAIKVLKMGHISTYYTFLLYSANKHLYRHLRLKNTVSTLVSWFKPENLCLK